MIEWKPLKQSKGKTVHNFIDEFRKQALALNVPLDTSEPLMKYIVSLHSYLYYSLLLFEPKSLDEASVKVVHLESRRKYEQYDCPKRVAIAKRREENPSCNNCEKGGHDEENCWKLHPELRPKRNDRKEKQKTIAIVQQD